MSRFFYGPHHKHLAPTLLKGSTNTAQGNNYHTYEILPYNEN